jgi:hypothetical protein
VVQCSFDRSFLCRSEAHRKHYIKLKIDFPHRRFRSEDCLGPKILLKLDELEERGLEAPIVYFVELTDYLKANPDKIVGRDEMCYEQVNGKTVAGAAWLY